MDNDSLKSGFSEGRSRRHHHPNGSVLSLPTHNRHNRSNNHTRSGRSSRREEPLLETPESGGEGEGGISRPPHEIIQVQMLPEEEWRDTATAITSDRSNSPDRSVKWTTIAPEPPPPSDLGWCQRYVGTVLGAVVVVVAIASPILMVVGQRVAWPPARGVTRECGPECHALLISLVVKLVALFGAVWAIYWKGSPATMPRIFFYRSIALLLAFLAAFSFWLFYWVRAEQEGELSIVAASAFAGGLADSLLVLHYLSVLLTELRHLSPQFQITVLRSPDGVSKSWIIGSLSIQRAAVWVLQNYYAEFPAFNPHLERLPMLRKRHASLSSAPSFKFYDFDSFTAGRMSSRRSAPSHNERFYEEHEYERRVRKRRARLMAATEDAFTHVKRLQDEQGPAVPLDSGEAAAAVFPQLARPLQKYLRITRQQPWHTAESVLGHLSTCLRLGLSPRAFLDKYLSYQPVLCGGGGDNVASWALVSDLSVSRSLTGDTQFLLKSGEVSLLVTVASLPHLNVTEQVVDPKSSKFTLRLSSETSV